MKRSFFGVYILFGILFTPLISFALIGVDALMQNLYLRNHEINSFEKNVESKEALSLTTYSSYLPTISAIGSYGQNNSIDLSSTQTGYKGYLEGKLNLFRGFKDFAQGNLKAIDSEIAKLDLEIKKRELQTELVDILSEMLYLHKLSLILMEESKIINLQKKMAEKKVSAGLTGSVDNLDFELRENEIQIEQKQIIQRHEEAHLRIIKLYGEDIADSEIDKINFSSLDFLIKSPSQLNYENSIEYKKISLENSKFEYEKTEIKSEFLPSLDFTYSVGRLTLSEDYPNKFDESKIALQLTIPLFSGFDTFYKTKSASFAAFAADKTKRQVANNINAEFGKLKTKITELSYHYQLNEKKILNSQKYFDLTLSEYRRGIKNSPDLVSATERLFSSRKKKYEILKDLELAKVKIENYN